MPGRRSSHDLSAIPEDAVEESRDGLMKAVKYEEVHFHLVTVGYSLRWFLYTHGPHTWSNLCGTRRCVALNLRGSVNK